MSEERLRSMLGASAEAVEVAAPPAFAPSPRVGRRSSALVGAASIVGAAISVAVVLDGNAASDPLRAPTPATDSRSTTSDDSLPRVTRIDLPTNGWKPGDRAMGAIVSGPLSFDNGCLLVGDEVAVWPAGWAAERRDFGGPSVLVLLAPNGDELTNHFVRAAGGYVTATEAQGACVQPGDEVVTITSEVRLGRGTASSMEDQLAASPRIGGGLGFVDDPANVVLCHVDQFGRDPGRIYAWVFCGTFRKGSDARPLSAFSVPMVLRVEPAEDGERLVGLDQPQDGDGYPDDVRRLFPPDLQEEAFGAGRSAAAAEAALRARAASMS